MYFLEFPIDAGVLASVRARFEAPKAPKVSLKAIGRQPLLWGRLRPSTIGTRTWSYGAPHDAHQMLGIVSRRPRLQLSAWCDSALAIRIVFIWL